MKVRASRILTGWNSPTKFLMPDFMEIQEDRVRILQREWMGLRREEEVIAIERIASIRLHEGLLKATVILETFGGSKDDLRISSVSKWRARKFRDKLHSFAVAKAATGPAS